MMCANVHLTNIPRQGDCTPHVVDRPPIPVHNVYMPKGKKGIKRTKKTKYSRHFLKEWRKKRGLTQVQLAERIDRTHPSIQRMENRTQALTQPVLDDLAIALKTTRGAILDRPPSNDE